MKKKVLGIMMAAMTLIAIPAVAQQPQNCENATTCTTVSGECAKNVKERGNRVCPYEGLNLSTEQKSRLSELDVRMQQARKAAKATSKEDRQRADSAKVADRKASRKIYLDEVKTIVGPEQYVVFLENYFVNGGNRPAKDMRAGKAVRSDKQHARHNDGRNVQGKKDKKKGDSARKGDSRKDHNGQNGSAQRLAASLK